HTFIVGYDYPTLTGTATPTTVATPSATPIATATPRAAYALDGNTFMAVYTTRDGVLRTVDTGLAYQSGHWYDLAITVDGRGASPTFTFLVSGQPIYSVTDTTSGSSTDPP